MILLLVGLVVAALHPAILRGVARLLVVDQPTPASDWVLPLSGDGCYPEAARRLSQGAAEQILVPRYIPGRLVLMEILPPYDQRATEVLRDLGVAPDRLSLTGREANGKWDEARLLNEWLRRHPDRTLVVLCNQFDSAQTSYIYDHELDQNQRQRVRIQAMVDRRYNASNWWQSGTGIKALFSAGFGLGYARLHGEDPPVDYDWDPDLYEMAMLP